jgi:hypothetical protein
MEEVRVFFGHLAYFTAIWYVGHFDIFFPFWYVLPRKIWQPCLAIPVCSRRHSNQ